MATEANVIVRQPTGMRGGRRRASHPAHKVIVERGELIEAYFCDGIMRAGIDDAIGVAQDAYLLMVGAVAASATRGNPNPARPAAVSIRRLLGRSESPKRVARGGN